MIYCVLYTIYVVYYIKYKMGLSENRPLSPSSSSPEMKSRSFRRITAVGITSKPAPRSNRGQHQSAKALWQYGAPAGADRKIYRKPWF